MDLKNSTKSKTPPATTNSSASTSRPCRLNFKSSSKKAQKRCCKRLGLLFVAVCFVASFDHAWQSCRAEGSDAQPTQMFLRPNQDDGQPVALVSGIVKKLVDEENEGFVMQADGMSGSEVPSAPSTEPSVSASASTISRENPKPEPKDQADQSIPIDVNRQQFVTHDQLMHPAEQQQQQQEASSSRGLLDGANNNAGLSPVALVSSFLLGASGAEPSSSSRPPCPGVCRSYLAPSLLCQHEIADAHCPSYFQRCCQKEDSGLFNVTPVQTSAPLPDADHDANSGAQPEQPVPAVPVARAEGQSSSLAPVHHQHAASPEPQPPAAYLSVEEAARDTAGHQQQHSHNTNTDTDNTNNSALSDANTKQLSINNQYPNPQPLPQEPSNELANATSGDLHHRYGLGRSEGPIASRQQQQQQQVSSFASQFFDKSLNGADLAKNSTASGQLPSLPDKCSGYCTLHLFTMLCDSTHRSADCGSSQKCCVTSQQQLPGLAQQDQPLDQPTKQDRNRQQEPQQQEPSAQDHHHLGETSVASSSAAPAQSGCPGECLSIIAASLLCDHEIPDGYCPSYFQKCCQKDESSSQASSPGQQPSSPGQQLFPARDAELDLTDASASGAIQQAIPDQGQAQTSRAEAQSGGTRGQHHDDLSQQQAQGLGPPEVASSQSATICRGFCVPVYHSSLCAKPNQLELSGCLPNYVCCSQSGDQDQDGSLEQPLEPQQQQQHHSQPDLLSASLVPPPPPSISGKLPSPVDMSTSDATPLARQPALSQAAPPQASPSPAPHNQRASGAKSGGSGFGFMNQLYQMFRASTSSSAPASTSGVPKQAQQKQQKQRVPLPGVQLPQQVPLASQPQLQSGTFVYDPSSGFVLRAPSQSQQPPMRTLIGANPLMSANSQVQPQKFLATGFGPDPTITLGDYQPRPQMRAPQSSQQNQQHQPPQQQQFGLAPHVMAVPSSVVQKFYGHQAQTGSQQQASMSQAQPQSQNRLQPQLHHHPTGFVDANNQQQLISMTNQNGPAVKYETMLFSHGQANHPLGEQALSGGQPVRVANKPEVKLVQPQQQQPRAQHHQDQLLSIQQPHASGNLAARPIAVQTVKPTNGVYLNGMNGINVNDNAQPQTQQHPLIQHQQPQTRPIANPQTTMTTQTGVPKQQVTSDLHRSSVQSIMSPDSQPSSRSRPSTVAATVGSGLVASQTKAPMTQPRQSAAKPQHQPQLHSVATTRHPQRPQQQHKLDEQSSNVNVMFSGSPFIDLQRVSESAQSSRTTPSQTVNRSKQQPTMNLTPSRLEPQTQLDQTSTQVPNQGQPVMQHSHADPYASLDELRVPTTAATTTTSTTSTTTTTSTVAPTVASTLQSEDGDDQQADQQPSGAGDKYTTVVANSCGIPYSSRRNSARVMGGSEAKPNHWCWQAALMNNKNEYLCGGALIGAKWVLTAAHCVTPQLRSESQLFVRLGQHNLNSSEQIASAKSVLVKTSYVHHNHNEVTLDNDIALLRLDQAVELDEPSICLVCLPDRDSPATSARCVVTGYGYEQEAGPAALRVRQAELPLVSDAECLNKTSQVLGKPFSLPANSFCAGGELGQDACSGDGGSPLSCLVDKSYYELTGIVSWGYKCGQKDLPGLYSKVSTFVSWINQIISVNN